MRSEEIDVKFQKLAGDQNFSRTNLCSDLLNLSFPLVYVALLGHKNAFLALFKSFTFDLKKRFLIGEIDYVSKLPKQK